MSNFYKYKEGRVWLQRKKFQTFQLLLPYGMTGVTDPVGNLNAIREPSAERRGDSVIADIVRGEPGLPQFQLDTRLQKTQNYMFGLRNCASQFQCHLGHCDRADNYYASSLILHWERARRGDLQLDRLSLLEGDNQAIQAQAPFVAEIGPVLFDMDAQFLSARTIAETEDATAIAMLGAECLEDCKSQEDSGENGYLATKFLQASPTNVANVWFTENKGETWAKTGTNPFLGGMDISDVLAVGTKNNHRVIVANGTTRGSDPAQIAYADVTDMGTTSWVTVDVGAVNGQYILDLLFLDWSHIFAACDDGYIYKSGDGGATWTAVYSPVGGVQANKMAGLRDGTVVCVGNSNTVLLSTDFGSSWSVVTGPSDGVGDDNTAVCLTPDGTIFIGNSVGELYGTYDNGVEWTALSLQGVTATAVADIASFGDSDIFVACNLAGPAGRVLRSVDGGASFRLWKLDIPTNAGLAALCVVDPNIVFAVGPASGGSAFVTRTISDVLGF